MSRDIIRQEKHREPTVGIGDINIVTCPGSVGL